MSVLEKEQILRRSFEAPDETRAFDKGRSEVVSLAELTLSRTVFEPGWRWSTSVKPLVGGESCQVRHIGYMLSGHLHTVMEDGSELDFGPGISSSSRPDTTGGRSAMSRRFCCR